MIARARLSGVLVLAATMVLASACDNTPVFDGERACGVDPALVAAVVGTDRFVVSDDEPATPLGPQHPRFDCSVKVGGDVAFTIRARLDAAYVDAVRAQVHGLPARFDYGQGEAGVSDTTAAWVCGPRAWLTMGVYDPEDVDLHPGRKDLRALLEAVVDRVGCGA